MSYVLITPCNNSQFRDRLRKPKETKHGLSQMEIVATRLSTEQRKYKITSGLKTFKNILSVINSHKAILARKD